MKAARNDVKFEPVTLVIESQAELDYLYAISNTAYSDAEGNAEKLGFVLTEESLPAQMNFYCAMKEFRKTN